MLNIFRSVVFILVSVRLYLLSRKSLRSNRFHGFYRFFAWEGVLALVLLNIDFRRYQLTSVHHILAAVLVTSSALLALHGFGLLRREGRLDSGRDDPTLLPVEKTTVLVTTGAYKYVRHPLYSSFLMLVWGSFFFIPSWPGGFVACFASINTLLAAWTEEQENLSYFGSAYCDYMKRTKRFIPFLI
jgi:protein-S-isoprenylcysteine O-methyltransferase Ste14